MSEPSKDPSGKFTRMNQVHASYHDFVCYLAYEQSTGLQVFWYEFLNDNLSNEQINNAFQKLTQVKSISSPYLLNILDVWKITNPSRFILITEATPAPSLAEYMKNIPVVPPRSVFRWFRQVAQAVQALHKSPLQIVHGRITMRNITVKATTGSIKLRLPLTDLSDRNISQSSLNFDIYKAPERIRGVFSPANDIWSLGIILLELLTNGKRPYSEYKVPIDLIRAISQHQIPESLADVAIPAAADLIRRCLQPEMFRISIDEILSHPALQETAATPQPMSQPNIQILVQNDVPQNSSLLNITSNSTNNINTNNNPDSPGKSGNLLDLS